MTELQIIQHLTEQLESARSQNKDLQGKVNFLTKEVRRLRNRSEYWQGQSRVAIEHLLGPERVAKLKAILDKV